MTFFSRLISGLSTATISATIIGTSVPVFAKVNINGAGSTFAEPLYTRWISDFAKTDTAANFNYQGIGSGAGIKQMIEGTIDFAGSDDPVRDAEAAKASAKILHVPIAIGAVVVSYNLTPDKPPGTPLKFSGMVLAKIFNGTINKWNDPEIVKLNPGVSLPASAISVATRSDGSGTTAVFSEYLSKVSPEWAGKNGKTVKWFPQSLGAKGNAGVAGLIKQNAGTIGYVELVYAVENKLPIALIQNKSNEFIEATSKSAGIAAEGIKKEAVAKDFKVSLTDGAQKGAYPIAAFTWMLIFDKMPKEKGAEILKLAKWIIGDAPQQTANQINYASVPKDVRAEVLKSLEKVKLD